MGLFWICKENRKMSGEIQLGLSQRQVKTTCPKGFRLVNHLFSISSFSRIKKRHSTSFLRWEAEGQRLWSLRSVGFTSPKQAVVPVGTEKVATVTGSYSSPISLPHLPCSTNSVDFSSLATEKWPS